MDEAAACLFTCMPKNDSLMKRNSTANPIPTFVNTHKKFAWELFSVP